MIRQFVKDRVYVFIALAKLKIPPRGGENYGIFNITC